MFKKWMLKEKMEEAHVTSEGLAAEIGINPATFSRKMNGVTEFTRNEIQIIRYCLQLTAQEVDDIFFAA